ncbi:MAG: hypothetical protein A7315_04740 [Candidatus Altiarchaeales archaeon WOR_SM1_79]|nr:MAG: hypothetical protein A7315_04740 [Candidatus Altiarchaeales archaeon WOR_SM1_79]
MNYLGYSPGKGTSKGMLSGGKFGPGRVTLFTTTLTLIFLMGFFSYLGTSQGTYYPTSIYIINVSDYNPAPGAPIQVTVLLLNGTNPLFNESVSFYYVMGNESKPMCDTNASRWGCDNTAITNGSGIAMITWDTSTVFNGTDYTINVTFYDTTFEYDKSYNDSINNVTVRPFVRRGWADPMSAVPGGDVDISAAVTGYGLDVKARIYNESMDLIDTITLTQSVESETGVLYTNTTFTAPTTMGIYTVEINATSIQGPSNTYTTYFYVSNMTVEKTGGGEHGSYAIYNEPINYTITITNYFDQDLENFMVGDDLPWGWKYDEGSTRMESNCAGIIPPSNYSVTQVNASCVTPGDSTQNVTWNITTILTPGCALTIDYTVRPATSCAVPDKADDAKVGVYKNCNEVGVSSGGYSAGEEHCVVYELSRINFEKDITQIDNNTIQINITISAEGGNESIKYKPTDAVLITDLSWSMEWCTWDKPGCTGPCTSECPQRLNTSKVADEQFVDIVLAHDALVGLVSYATDTRDTHNLSSNDTSLKMEIDSYTAATGPLDRYTCICCGILNATNIFDYSSEHRRGIAAMTDGEANKRCSQCADANFTPCADAGKNSPCNLSCSPDWTSLTGQENCTFEDFKGDHIGWKGLGPNREEDYGPPWCNSTNPDVVESCLRCATIADVNVSCSFCFSGTPGYSLKPSPCPPSNTTEICATDLVHKTGAAEDMIEAAREAYEEHDIRVSMVMFGKSTGQMGALNQTASVGGGLFYDATSPDIVTVVYRDLAYTILGVPLVAENYTLTDVLFEGLTPPNGSGVSYTPSWVDAAFKNESMGFNYTYLADNGTMVWIFDKIYYTLNMTIVFNVSIDPCVNVSVICPSEGCPEAPLGKIFPGRWNNISLNITNCGRVPGRNVTVMLNITDCNGSVWDRENFTIFYLPANSSFIINNSECLDGSRVSCVTYNESGDKTTAETLENGSSSFYLPPYPEAPRCFYNMDIKVRSPFAGLINEDINAFYHHVPLDNSTSQQGPTNMTIVVENVSGVDVLYSDDFEVVQEPDISITKNVSNFTEPGEVVTYTIVVNNSGNGSAVSLTVRDTIPENTTFVGWTNYTDSSGLVTYGSYGRTHEWNLTQLDAGEIWEINLSVYVHSNASMLENTAILRYIDNSTLQPVDNLSSTAPDVTVRHPYVNITKSVASQLPAGPGENVTFTLTVNNSGNGTAHNLSVSDAIQENVTFVGWANSTTSSSGGEVTNYSIGRTHYWNLTNMSGNSVWTINFTVLVHTNCSAILPNYGNVDYVDGAGSNFTDGSNPAPNESSNATKAAFLVSKVSVQPVAEPGDMVTYIVNITNNGDASVYDVEFEDILPAGFNYTQGSVTGATMVSEGTSGLSKVVTFHIGTISANTTVSVSYNATVTSFANFNSSNYVTVSGKDGDGRPIMPDVVSSPVYVYEPELEVSKSADKTTAEPGDYVIFMLNITNTVDDGTGGKPHLENITVIDILPDGFEFINATPSEQSVSGQEIRFNISLDGGETEIITITTRVRSDAISAFNTLQATGYMRDGTPLMDDDELFVTIGKPKLTASKEIVDAELVGDILTTSYRITLKNVGSGTAYNITFKDLLQVGNHYDAGSMRINDTIPSTDASETDGILTLNKTWNLSSGEELVITYNCSGNISTETPDHIESGSNLVRFEAVDGNGTHLSIPVATAGTGIVGISKNASHTFVEKNESVRFTVTIEAIANVSDVVVIDTLPENWDYDMNSASMAPGSTNPLTFNLGNLAPSNGTIIIGYNATPNCSAGPVGRNNATANFIYGEYPFNRSLSSSAEVSVRIEEPPVLLAKKTINQSSVEVGDIVEFKVEIKNVGESKVYDLNVTDILPSGLKYVNNSASIGNPDSIIGNKLIWGNVGDLDSGETFNFTYKVNVTPGAAEFENENWVRVMGVTSCEKLVKDAYASLDINKPHISLEKEVEPLTADYNDVVRYKITIRNQGDGKAYYVNLTDSYPAGFELMGCDCENLGNCSPVDENANPLVWNIGTMQPYQTSILLCSMKINSSATIGANTNDLTLYYYDKLGTENETTANATVNVGVPAAVDIYKEIQSIDPQIGIPPMAERGSLIIYEITVKNNNSEDKIINNVKVYDIIPYGGTFEGSSRGGYSTNPVPGGTQVIWTIGNMSAGSIVTFTYNVTINENASTGFFNNQAIVNGTYNNGTDDIPVRDEYDELVWIVQEEKLVVEKSSNKGTLRRNENLTFTVTTRNDGESHIYNLNISDTLPSGFGYIPSSTIIKKNDNIISTADPSEIGNMLFWNIDETLGKGDTVTLSYGADINESAESGCNRVEVNGSNALDESVYANDSRCVVIGVGGISVSKSAEPTSASPGDTVTYTVTIQNTGNTRVYLNGSDTLPDGFNYVGGSLSGATFVSYGNNVLNFSLSLDGGDTVDVTYAAEINSSASQTSTNTVVVNGTDDAGNPIDGGSDGFTVTIGYADATITKQPPTPITQEPGYNINYTLTVTNTGNATIYNVTVWDTIPDGYSFVDSDPAPSYVDGRTYTWVKSSLGYGVSPTWDIVLTLKLHTNATTVNNTVYLNYSDASGHVRNDTDSNADLVILTPDVVVTEKDTYGIIRDGSVADSPVWVGDRITYRIRVEEQEVGGGAHANVTITDTAPAGLVHVGCNFSQISGHALLSGNCSAAPPTAGGTNVTWQFRINPNQHGYLEVTFRVNTSIGPHGTVFNNTVSGGNIRSKSLADRTTL